MTFSKTKRTQNVRGHLDSQGRLQIAVRLDSVTFDALKEQAIKDKMSIAEKIRDYINVGLSVDEELDDTPEITTFEGVSS